RLDVEQVVVEGGNMAPLAGRPPVTPEIEGERRQTGAIEDVGDLAVAAAVVAVAVDHQGGGVATGREVLAVEGAAIAGGEVHRLGGLLRSGRRDRIHGPVYHGLLGEGVGEAPRPGAGRSRGHGPGRRTN